MSKYLSREGVIAMEKHFTLTDRAIYLLGYVVSEWQSSPESVKCFNSRLVTEAKLVVNSLKDINIWRKLR